VSNIRPYTGVRILDGTWRLGRYATRLFADLGADVVRIEPPGGLPDRHITALTNHNITDADFAFSNASKRSVVIDTTVPEGRAQLDELAKGAQIIIAERGGALFEELSRLREVAPQAVVTFISPYGLGGPDEASPASDLVLQAAGGIAWLSGRADGPPLRLPINQSSMITSVYAAAATAIALFDSEERGRGHIIDVSAQECIAHSLQNAIQVWDLEKRVSRRGGEGTRDASEDIFPCKDGYVFIATPPTLGVSWKSLVGWTKEVGHSAHEEFSQERWLDRKWRTTAEARGLFRQNFEAFIGDFTRAELASEAIARKIVMSPVARVCDLVDDEQLQYRGFFQAVDNPHTHTSMRFPGAPYRLSEGVWDVSAAPELGEYGPDTPGAHDIKKTAV